MTQVDKRKLQALAIDAIIANNWNHAYVYVTDNSQACHLTIRRNGNTPRKTWQFDKL